jgi:putative transposase
VVGYLRGGYQVSERRACIVVKLNRGTYRYEGHKDPQTELRMRMREIAAVRVRYGCRKILVMLQREGWAVGKTKVSRLYREEGLALRRTVPRRRRVAVERRARIKPTGPNQVWSLDFVSDQLVDGRRFRSLTVVDVYTRESLAIEAGQSLRGEDVVRVLQQIQKSRGTPRTLFCDNGSEFSSQVLDLWAYQNGVKIDFSRPGKPTDNAHIESFNGTFRDECLNAHWFMTLEDACEIIEAWRKEYNESRPHRALGERTPREFAFQIAASCDLKALQSPQDSP